MTNIDLDSLLGSLVAKYAAKAEKAPKEPKAKKVNVKAEALCPVNAAPAPFVATLPTKGSVNGEGFLRLFRAAKNRDDEIAAIAAYIGYSRDKDAPSHGAQELAAKTAARKERTPLVVANAATAPLHHAGTASATVAGYVAGTPDGIAKLIANLKGRERAAIDALIAHDRTVNDLSRAVDVRNEAAGLARLEAERIEAIRLDLKAAGA